MVLPVTGELSGTWGETVNNGLTSLLDSAVAGTTTLSTDADVTLTTTTGSSNQARQAIILWTASGTVTRTITAPAQSKIYTVINNSGSTQSIKLVGVGPTTGVTIVKGESAVCAWNGSDFIKISINNGAATFTSITDTALTSGRVTYAGTGGLLQDSSNLTFNGTTLTAGGFTGPIGATSATTGAFTTLSASSTVSGAGFSTYLASPPAIGSTAANTGAFTTLSASSTVSGTGFSTYLASPPAIGGTAQNTGYFTTLRVYGSSSGYVGLQGAAAAGSTTYTLPATDGTAGYALVTNGSGTLSWSTVGGTPGGSTTQVQYNNAGVFAGSANMTFNGTTLTVAGLAGPLNGTVGATTQNTGYFTTLRMYGSSSGYVGFQGAAAAGSTTYTLPAADGTNGYALVTNGTGTLSWAAVGGTPGGSNTQVQFNNSGAFGGVSGFTYDSATSTLTAPNVVTSNGIHINSTTVSSNITIATGNNGFSVGPMTVASGATVTVSSGQQWVVI